MLKYRERPVLMFYWPDLINLKPIYKNLSFKWVLRKVHTSFMAKVVAVLDINKIKEIDAR
jgi:hypothetical protein